MPVLDFPRRTCCRIAVALNTAGWPDRIGVGTRLGRGHATLFQRFGQTEPDAVRFFVLRLFRGGAQHHVQLADMLNQLGLSPGRVCPIKCQDIRREKADALYPHYAHVAAGKAHADFMFAIQLFFKVLDIKHQPFIGPFRRRLFLKGAVADGLGQRFLLGGFWR